MGFLAGLNESNCRDMVEVTTISISIAGPGHPQTSEKDKSLYKILRETAGNYGIDSGFYPSSLFRLFSNS